MDVLVVAGEASGDRHAADVVAALKAARPGLRFFGMGGPALAAQGVELIHGAHEISVMGFTEVLPKIPRIREVMGDLAAAAE
jgi:lipid-A-disaccharide synthase